MPRSFSVTDTSLWPALGQIIAEGARYDHVNRETAGPGVFMRTYDRAGGMETTGAPPIEQSIYGGIVAGNFLDTLAAGTHGPRDAVGMNHELVSSALIVHTGNGVLVDTVI